MNIQNLIKAEFTMLFGEIKSYYVNYIFYNISIIFLFVGLFISIDVSSKQEAFIMLFELIVWNLASSSLSTLTYIIQDESQLGTLEQIFMTRISYISVIFVKIMVNTVFIIIKAAIIFLICALPFGLFGSLSIIGSDCINIIVISLLVTLTFNFIGFIFGGLSLFYKRIQSITSALSYVLLFFTGIMVSIDRLPKYVQPLVRLIPISDSAILIDKVIQNPGFDYLFQYQEFWLILLSMSIWCVASLSFFNRMIAKAKIYGKLGQY